MRVRYFHGTIPVLRVSGWHVGQKNVSCPWTPARRMLSPQRGQACLWRLRTFKFSRDPELDAIIHEFRIHDRALTASEIAMSCEQGANL